MLAILILITGTFCERSFENRLGKAPVDLYRPPFTFMDPDIDAQLSVVPNILNFLAEFTNNPDMKKPELAVNYLNSISVPPYRMFEMRELVYKLARLGLPRDITRLDRLEVAVLLREPNEISTELVAELYKELMKTLMAMELELTDGRTAYLVTAIAGAINRYDQMKDLFKAVGKTS